MEFPAQDRGFSVTVRSRANLAKRNALVSLLGSCFLLVVLFVVRTALVEGVDQQFLGLHAVLTNFNALFAMAELGVAVGMVHRYAPGIARGDANDVAAARQAATKFFRIAGFAMVVLIFLAIPGPLYLFREDNFTSSDLLLYYFLFSGGAIATVQLSQVRVLLSAHQLGYRVLIVELCAAIPFTVAQCYALLAFHSYSVYVALLSLQIISVLLLVRILARRSLPAIYSARPAPSDVARHWYRLKQDLVSLAAFRIGAAALNATDGILIALLISTAVTGYWSNYALMFTAATTILMRVVDSLTGSISNHVASADSESRLRVFHELSSLTLIVFAGVSVILGVCLTPLVVLWLGEEFALGADHVWMMAMVFFAVGSNQTTSQYRWSLGLFRPARFIPVVAVTLNVGLSIALAGPLGLFGILLASLIARFGSFSWIDPLLVLRKGLGGSVRVYYIRLVVFTMGVSAAILTSQNTLAALDVGGEWGPMVTSVILAFVSFLIFVLAPALAFGSVRGAFSRVIKDVLGKVGV